MRNVRNVLRLSCLLVVFACSSGSENNLYSSENLISTPKNVVQALTLDVPLTCWQASRRDDKPTFHVSETEALRRMKVAECENRELNEAYPHQTRITVVVHLASLANDTSLYLRYVPLYFTDRTIGKAAQKLLNLAGFPDSLAPEKAVISSAIGSYSASSYLRAIRTTTPLIIFLPMKIQGQKLTPDVYQEACIRVKSYTRGH
jgi:hypothetical protein